MKFWIRFWFLLFPVLPIQAQNFNPLLANMLQDTLNTYVASIPNIKGLSVSVSLPGQGIWQGVTGVSQAGLPISSDMEFGIASNSKLFVSAALLLLEENGWLNLDDSLHEWLPPYPNINPDITIRQLLNHSSGIHDPIFIAPWVDTIMAYPTRYFTPAEVVSWIGPPMFAPGTSWGYSNPNYILAGMVAESATGLSIAQIIRDSILSPLNLDSTFFDIQEPEVGIVAHRWWNNVDFHDTSRIALNSVSLGAGALFSNSSEMAQWYRALFSGQILSPTSMASLSNFIATGNPTYTYGLGLRREITNGLSYWGHGGDTWGYRSKMIYDTCLAAVVCGLSNSFPSGMNAVTFLLYRVLKNHLPGCPSAIAGPIVVCQGQDSVTYSTAPIANATNYVWTLPGGVAGSSNTNIITVNFGMSSVSGEISVRGENIYGVGNSSSFEVMVDVCTGLRERQFVQNKLKIFPNPFSDYTIIKAPRVLNHATLKLYDVHGMKIKEVNQISGESFSFFRESLPQGLYFIELSEENRDLFFDKWVIIN